MNVFCLSLSLIFHYYRLLLLIILLDSIKYPHRTDKVVAGQLTLMCKSVGFHGRTSQISSFLLPQQYPECLAHLILMVCEMGNEWPYNDFCLVLFPEFV